MISNNHLNEEEKYKVELCKISGFALMTPFGRLVMDPLLYKGFDFPIFFSYMLFCLMLTTIGITLLLIGRAILIGKRGSTWQK